MTLFTNTPGQRFVYDEELTTTGEVTVMEVTKDGVIANIESIYISSDTTSTVLTLLIKNGSTTLFKLVDGITFTSSQLITNYHRPLRKGHKITAQAGTADHLSVSVVTVETRGDKEPGKS
jgi:hypothetical protein